MVFLLFTVPLGDVKRINVELSSKEPFEKWYIEHFFFDKYCKFTPSFNSNNNCYYNNNKWSKNFDKRTRRRRTDFSCGQCNNIDQSGVLQSAAAVQLSCRYWGLNDPFAAYTTAETPNAFQWTGKPPKLSLPWGISASSNTWILGPARVSTQTASRSVQPFVQGSRTRDQHTQTHTHALEIISSSNSLRGIVFPKNAEISKNFQVSRHQAVITPQWLQVPKTHGQVVPYGMSSFRFYL